MSEELIVRHCSPTLAGMKTGNLFRCSYTTREELRGEICRLNRRLRTKGLRILLLRSNEKDALIYVYRPEMLRFDLSHAEAAAILEQHDYLFATPAQCIAHLISRIKETDSFPHEIGLFLGYPPEDVRGFIENNAQNCKLIGHWKVYGDAEKAKHTFASYKACTDGYMRRIQSGHTLEQLTVAV